MKIDWDKQAVKAANYIGSEMFKAHRGAMKWHRGGIIVAFGNDGYTDDDRSQKEVEFLRERLADTNLAPVELGFGVCEEDGYTWAMLLRVHPSANTQSTLEWLTTVIWDGWEDGERSRGGKGSRGAAWDDGETGGERMPSGV